jgi:hypothetical protein
MSGLDQLSKRTRSRAESHLDDDEEIVTVLVGRSKQAMVVTNRQLLIVKSGLMAGAALNSKAGSFPLAAIAAVNVHTGRGVAALEIVPIGQETAEKPDLRAAFQLSNWLPCQPSLAGSAVVGELRAYVQSAGRSRSARAELSAFENDQ